MCLPNICAYCTDGAAPVPAPHQALPEELAALTAQATDDLTTFLTLRAAEFMPGGLLVMSYGTLDTLDSNGQR